MYQAQLYACAGHDTHPVSWIFLKPCQDSAPARCAHSHWLLDILHPESLPILGPSHGNPQTGRPRLPCVPESLTALNEFTHHTHLPKAPPSDRRGSHKTALRGYVEHHTKLCDKTMWGRGEVAPGIEGSDPSACWQCPSWAKRKLGLSNRQLNNKNKHRHLRALKPPPVQAPC